MILKEKKSSITNKIEKIELIIETLEIRIGFIESYDDTWLVYFEEYMCKYTQKIAGDCHKNINDAKQELLNGYLLFLKFEMDKIDLAKSKLNKE